MIASCFATVDFSSCTVRCSLRNSSSNKRAVPIYAALSDLPIEVDADVIVYTPEEIQEWSGASASFVTTALREGTVLYER